MSKKGEEAHNQWIERQKSGHLGTETKDMGHLTEETEGMKHHHDPIDADHAPEAEFIANNNVKGRKMLGDEATKNNEAWMKRQQSGKLHTMSAADAPATTVARSAVVSVSRDSIVCLCGRSARRPISRAR